MALKHDQRIAISLEQRIVIRLIEQASPVDRGEGALFVGADIDQFVFLAALDQRET